MEADGTSRSNGSGSGRSAGRPGAALRTRPTPPHARRAGHRALGPPVSSSPGLLPPASPEPGSRRAERVFVPSQPRQAGRRTEPLRRPPAPPGRESGHPGPALPPEGEAVSREPPTAPRRNYAVARPKAARTRPQRTRRRGRGGGPDARDPGLQAAPAGCSRLRRRGPPEGSGPARAAPPPPAGPHAPWRLLHAAPRAPVAHERSRPPGRGLEPAAVLTPLRLASAASPSPCLGSTVGRRRMHGPAPGRLRPHSVAQPGGAARESPAPPRVRAAPDQRRPRPDCRGLVLVRRGAGYRKRRTRAPPRGRDVDATSGIPGSANRKRPCCGGRGIGCGAKNAAPPRTCFR